MNPDSSSAEFFETMYRAKKDPWDFASSPTELDRYTQTLAALGQRRFHHAWEPACSVGVLTAQLAEKCDRVTAFDLSPTAATTARQRCAPFANVDVSCGSVLEAEPPPGVDLLVLSEIGYYFSQPVWKELLSRLLHQVEPDCTVVAVHWLGVSEDHCLSGDQVHDVIRAEPRLRLLHEERFPTFRLDLLQVQQGEGR